MTMRVPVSLPDQSQYHRLHDTTDLPNEGEKASYHSPPHISKLENFDDLYLQEEGVSLHEAKKIDRFVNKYLSSWEQQFDEAVAQSKLNPDDIIVIKKEDFDDLPRSLQIGIEFDLITDTPKMQKNGKPLMHIMVLDKCKESFCYQERGEIKEAIKKVPPFGKGLRKVVKKAFDWRTKEQYVQIMISDENGISGTGLNEFSKERVMMERLMGCDGVAAPGFMIREYIKKDKKIHRKVGVISYFMHRYKCNLTTFLNKTSKPFTIEQSTSLIFDLAESARSYRETATIHCDGKSDNTLVNKNNTLVTIDNGLANTLEGYLKRLDAKKSLRGNIGYSSPEVINGCTSECYVDLKEYPFARDMWSYGLQALQILAAGNNELNFIVNRYLDSTYMLIIQYNEAQKVIQNEEEIKAYLLDKNGSSRVNALRERFVKDQANNPFPVPFDHVLKTAHGKKQMIIYKQEDDFISESIFQKFERALVLQTPNNVEKAKELLATVRMMLRADPRNRIIPEKLFEVLTELRSKKV